MLPSRLEMLGCELSAGGWHQTSTVFGYIGTPVAKCLLYHSSLMLQILFNGYWYNLWPLVFNLYKNTSPPLPFASSFVFNLFIHSLSPVKRKNTMIILVKKGASWICRSHLQPDSGSVAGQGL